MKTIAVADAKHIEGFKVEVVFNDQKRKVVDFGTFLNTHSHPQFNKYKSEKNFKKFKIENGNIVWGKDWDMIFPIHLLYEGRVH